MTSSKQKQSFNELKIKTHHSLVGYVSAGSDFSRRYKSPPGNGGPAFGDRRSRLDGYGDNYLWK